MEEELVWRRSWCGGTGGGNGELSEVLQVMARLQGRGETLLEEHQVGRLGEPPTRLKLSLFATRLP